MKIVRRISKHPIVLASVLSPFLIVSCAKETVMKETIEYSGKQIMEGVFFAQGPVVEEIPSLKNAVDVTNFIDSNDELEAINLGMQNTLDALEKKFPGSFDDFKFKIASGDHIVIDQTLSDYRDRLYDVLIEQESELKQHIDDKVLEESKERVMRLVNQYQINPSSSESSKEMLNDPKLHQDFELLYNDIREQSLNSGRLNSTEQATCIFWFGALAAWVYIWWAVLAWTFFWAWNYVDWGGIIVAQRRVEPGNSLLHDQIVNDIVINLSE